MINSRGSKENAPDLDSLRLFLAEKCNSPMQDQEVVFLFADLTNYSDDIDHGSAARICFRHLHNFTCVDISSSSKGRASQEDPQSSSTKNKGIE